MLNSRTNQQKCLYNQFIASQTNQHPGIAYCSPNSRSIGEIIRCLILIYEVYTPEEMIGRLNIFKKIAINKIFHK